LCFQCHDLHRSEHRKLLRTHFPEEYYLEFESGSYDLCWRCHERSIVLEEKTGRVTGFRNGTRNLHFVHVNQRKGRSCKACHTTEAQSSQDSLMRDAVPFGSGGWKLPIQFTRFDTGGNCVVGCHREMTYDRDDPASY
jgi:hypothetical protein